MTRFTFRLESLLSLRRGERDACRAELAAALAEQREVANRRQALAAEFERQQDWQRTVAMSGPIDLNRLRDGQSYEAALRGQSTQLGESEQLAAARVDSGREALATAEREVRVLEKLRERRRLEHDREQSRRAQRHFDETASRVREQARQARV